MRRLTPALKQEIRAFGFLYSQITADFMLPERAETQQTFQDALESFAALPADWAQYELARPTFFYGEEDAGGPESLGREEVRAQIRRCVSMHGSDGAALAEQLLAEPAAVQARVAAMLAAYWDESFAEEWTRLEPILAAEVERAEGVDPIVLLGAVRSEMRIDAEQRLLVRRSGHEHDVTVEARNPLRLIPSVYVWPHVRVNCDPPWPLAVLYPPASMPGGHAGTPPPVPLVKALSAVADPTRLRILRLVGEQPRSTEELAPLVGLSESGLSKHLRALTNAGLVSSGRSGWYVLYRLERESLQQLGSDLLRYLS
jgi:DNA-binding transcriptional ArsR family regulator